MVITQFNLSKNICFYENAHNSRPRGSPDMITTPFDMKIHEKKDEIPPEACRPSKKLKKNNLEKEDHNKVEQKTMSKKWVQKVKKKQCRQKWPHIPSYTPTYSKILNIRKMRANIKHKNSHNSDPRASRRVRIWSK